MNMSVSLFKQRLRDCYLQEWHESVVNCRKLNIYRYCKDTIEMAPYHKILRERKHRSIIMAKFRCSNHQLAIETGRHAPVIIDRNDRICIYCERTFDIRIVEDEYHFLIVCPAYQYVRTQYLSDILDKFNINNETIMSILLKSFNENVVKAISFFLYHAFYVRNNYMQNEINV